MMSVEPPREPPQESLTHAEWWNANPPAQGEPPLGPAADAEVLAPYTDAQAAASLGRSVRLVLWFTAVGAPVAWLVGGWRYLLALAIGAAISGSGLWEYRRLTGALAARMDAAKLVQPESTPRPSIGFAVAGFLARFAVVLAVLYVSLKHLHGSVPALAAGLLLGVLALFAEAFRLLRSGTI